MSRVHKKASKLVGFVVSICDEPLIRGELRVGKRNHRIKFAMASFVVSPSSEYASCAHFA
jgi:hypothetical protein